VFPRADAAWIDPAAEAEMQLVQGITVKCRMLRKTYNVRDSDVVAVEVRSPSEEARKLIEKYLPTLEQVLRKKTTFKITADGTPIPGAARAVVRADVEIIMPLGGLIDVPVERARIQKEIAKADKEIATIEAKLGKPDFIEKAQKEVVEEQRTRLVDQQSIRKQWVEALETLGGAA
jgi:valyl-tRNA synthetase